MPTINVGDLRTTWTGDTDDIQDSVSRASDVVKKSFEKIKDAGSLVTGTFDKVRDFGKRAKESLDKLDISAEDLSRTYGALKNNFNEGADLAQLGAASLRVEDRFDKFAAAAGGADEILAAFQKGVGGTASEMDAMSISSGLLQAGLVKSAEGMERTTEIASRLGDQTIGVSNRIDAFGQLLKNQSIQLLDNFGISSGRVREQIKLLQEEDKTLTREQAFLNATFAEADAALKILGPRTEDHLTAMERQAAASANLEVEIGQKLAPAYAKLADFQANMNTETAIAIQGFQKGFGTAVELSGGIDKLAINFGKLATKMGTSSAALGGLGLAVGALILANEKLQQTLDKMDASFDSAEKAGSELGSSLEGLTVGSDEWNKSLDGVVTKLKKANKIYEDSAIASGIIGDAFGADAAMADVMSAALDSIDQEIQAGSDNYGIYLLNVNKVNKALEDSNVQLPVHNKNFFEAEKRYLAAAEAAAKWTDAQRDQAAALEIVFSNLATAEEKAAANLVITRAATEAQEKQAKALERTSPLWGAATANQARAAQRAEQMTTVTEELSNQIQAQGGALEEQQAQAEESLALNEKITASVEEQITAYEKSMDLARERIALQQDEIKSQLDRAEALKGAGEEEIARAAIQELEKAQQAGLITFDDFTKAVVEIQDRFGLADDESRALTLGLGTLVDEFATGGIAADSFDDALALLIEDAKDGVVAFDELKKTIEAVKNETGETEKVFNAATGQFEDMAIGAGAGGEQVFNAATGQFEAAGAPQQQGAQTFNAATGQFEAPQQQPAAAGGMTIYGGLHLEGVQNVEDFLAQLQALTPLG